MRFKRPLAAAFSLGLLYGWMESLILHYGLSERLLGLGFRGTSGAVLFLFFHCLAYLVIGLASLAGLDSEGSRLIPLAAAALVISLPLLMDPTAAASVVPLPLALTTTAFSAVGLALLFGHWGVFLSTLSPDDVALIFGLSPLAATFFIRLSVAVDLRLLLLGAPLIAAALFLAVEGEKTEMREQLPPLPNFPFWRLSLFLFFFYAANGFLLSLIPDLFPSSFARADQVTDWVKAFSALAMALAFRYWPRADLRNFYRGAFPFIAAALFLLRFSSFRMASRLFLEGGLALLDLYAWLLLIYYASRTGRRRTVVINWGLFLIIFAGAVAHVPLLFDGELFLFPGESQAASLALLGLFLLLLVLALWDGREVAIEWGENGAADGDAETSASSEEKSLTEEEEMFLRMKLIQFNLTRQETEVALLLLKGQKNINICSLLYISQNTLKYHLRNIYRKTGSSNRKEFRSVLD